MQSAKLWIVKYMRVSSAKRCTLLIFQRLNVYFSKNCIMVTYTWMTTDSNYAWLFVMTKSRILFPLVGVATSWIRLKTSNRSTKW